MKINIHAASLGQGRLIDKPQAFTAMVASMKILFLGRSPVAALYGWALEHAGHLVAFSESPNGANPPIDIHGVRVLDARTSSHGKTVTEGWSPRLCGVIPENHSYDFVVIAVRHDLLVPIVTELGSRIGQATAVILGNLWNDTSSVSSHLPEGQTIWAYPSAGGSVDEEGILDGALLGIVHLGSKGTELTFRERTVSDLFDQSGFTVKRHVDFRSWLWLQFVVSAGLGAQSLEAGSAEALMSSPVQLKRSILMIRELFPLVSARGVNLRGFSTETGPFRFPAWLGGLILQNTLRSQEAVRTVWRAADDVETAIVCRDVLAEARRLNVPVPRLEALEALFS